MPVYEFKCVCGQENQRNAPIAIGRVILPVCICGKIMKRKFSPPGIILKGKGFYKTTK